MIKVNNINIKDLYESLGGDGLIVKIGELIGGEEPLMTPDDFNFKEIYEAVDPTAFPVIAGQLISKKVMDAYILEKKIGDSLTTTMVSKLEIDKVTGLTEAGAMKKVKAGMPYEHTGDIGEKWVQIKGDKYGKILDILEETVMFDQTGKILLRAGQIGEGAAAFREKHILNTIQDIAGYYAYYPSGTRVVLYSSGHVNQITNKLEAWDDLDAANVKLGVMKDEKGDPITIRPTTLLVPIALDAIANRLYGPIMAGAANQEANPFAGRFSPISSPYLDAQSAIIWYLGNFKKQFIWKEVIPMQVLTRKSNDNEASWERDVIASFKVRYFGECGALDYRYVCKSTGAA